MKYKEFFDDKYDRTDELTKVYLPNTPITIGYHAFSPETAIYNKVTNKPLTFL